MGCGGSKEDDSPILDMKYIYYDDDGNIRHSGPDRDREDELKKVMMVDKDEDDGVSNVS